MVQFVVAYNRLTGEADVREFSGEDAVERALDARFLAEATAGPSTEIASLSARDLDELKVTHARFFRGASDMVGEFQRLIAS